MNYAKSLMGPSYVTQSANTVVNAEIEYISQGSCSYGCEYGSTAFANSCGGSKIPISIFSFESNEAAERYASALRFYKDNKHFITLLFVNEQTKGETYHVVVPRIRYDISSYIAEAGANKDWENYVGNCYKTVLRDLATIVATILSEPKKKFKLSSLMSRGVVAIDENTHCPMIARIETVPDYESVNYTSVVEDLGNTMEKFLVDGAVDAPQQLNWKEKMECLKIPKDLIDFIDLCKNSSFDDAVTAVWCLDSSTLWENNERIAWIYKLADLVSSWRKHEYFLEELDVALKEMLIFDWESFIPKPSRIFEKKSRIFEILEEYKTRVPDYQEGSFHNLARFARHVIEKYDKQQHDKIGKSRACDQLETMYNTVGGLCKVLRDVLETVFYEYSFFRNSDDINWKNALTAEFEEITSR